MIYLDNAATTPLDPGVRAEMEVYFGEVFGNPNSIHAAGRQAREAVENARETVAACLGASPNEIIFTGGGSESNNLAIRGVASARRSRGRRIVVSAIEHPSVLETCHALEREGFELTIIPVDPTGLVDPAAVADAIESDTILVTVMHANNEVGTVESIAVIGDICRERNVYFHSDAVQTTGKLPIDVDALGVDLHSLSGHKIYGPKGVGALYIRSGTRLHAQITGGGQEKNRRSGTENVAGIVGLAAALKRSVDRLGSEAAAETALRDRLLTEIPERVPDTIVTGHPTRRLPNHASFCFRGVEGEAVLLALDQIGIAASAGSACSSGSLEPPHALLAMGVPPDYAHGSLRISLGRQNTSADVDAVIESLPPIVAKLRSLARPAPV
ncbi:MAG TPA: cysteine desulfurase family protein [Armatimonadota bacterium]|nr:cysteine desulfurase family protein [Armatimonadota bacterium]